MTLFIIVLLRLGYNPSTIRPVSCQYPRCSDQKMLVFDRFGTFFNQMFGVSIVVINDVRRDENG